MCTFSKTYFKYLYASTYNLNWWAFLQKELCHMLPLCKNLNAEIRSQVWHVSCKSLEKNFCYTSVFLLGYEVEGFSPYCERVFQFFFFFKSLETWLLPWHILKHYPVQLGNHGRDTVLTRELIGKSDSLDLNLRSACTSYNCGKIA